MPTNLRTPLLLAALVLGGCSDGRPTEPNRLFETSSLAISTVGGDQALYFLPPMVPDSGPFTGTFDASVSPTARVVCTGATGTACPQIASFGGDADPAIKLDVEGQAYSAVWHTPASLALGKDLYRLEIHDGAALLGSADLWVVDVRQAMKTVSSDYVGVVRGSPLQIKFRIETGSNARPAVALVEVTPATSSVLAGASVQLSAVTKDAGGNVLTDRPVSWASSDAAVATVSSAGLVTTLAPGNVTITATSETESAVAAVESVDPTYIPFFQRPYSVNFEVQTTNYHDHNEPREFVDANGIYLPYWGEPSLPGIDGHEGYDWRLPIGTPITAVAAGQVVAAALTGTPFFCPILNTMVDGNSRVVIEHSLPGGVRVRTAYVHVDQIGVQVGQVVTAGQVIATSGDRGCALNPHLHFAVYRLTQTNSGGISPIDPYGWEGPNTDPWLLDPDGAASIRLWKPGEAPTLFRSALAPLGATAGPFVQITAVRFQGPRDDLNPNNEYVEVTRDARVAPAELDLGGFTLTTRAGLVFTFPAGTVLSASVPSIRVFTGGGTASAGLLYWGRSAGVLDNLAECVRFRNAAGVLRNLVGWGGGCLS